MLIIRNHRIYICDVFTLFEVISEKFQIALVVCRFVCQLFSHVFSVQLCSSIEKWFEKQKTEIKCRSIKRIFIYVQCLKQNYCMKCVVSVMRVK